MGITLKYIWIKFEGEDYCSYCVGDGGVKTIRWNDDGFIFVVYEDRATVLNANNARYLEIVEA